MRKEVKEQSDIVADSSWFVFSRLELKKGGQL
jgi:hypothetical protein